MSPSRIDLEGDIAVSLSGTILKRANIGKTSADPVSLWNEQNPDDQVLFSQNQPARNAQSPLKLISGLFLFEGCE